MQACGCSRRAVRHAQEQLQGSAPSYAKPLLALSALLVIGLAAYGLWPTSSPEQAAKTSKQVQAQEAAIYSALDARDASQASRISEHLASPEESLRLAALRFVATVDPEPYLARLLPLVDDESKRVRAAAVQLLGGVKPSEGAAQGEVTDKLVAVLVDEKRELAERVLAVSGLKQRKPRDLRALLPVLDEARLSGQVAALLTKWSGKSVTAAEARAVRDQPTRPRARAVRDQPTRPRVGPACQRRWPRQPLTRFVASGSAG